MKRAAIYVRVSRKVGQSQRHQFAALRELARVRDFRVVAVYRDRMSGGTADRPGLRALMHGASMRRFDVVCVWALDRLGRSLVQVVANLERLEGRGVGFVSLKEAAIDTTTAAGRLITNVLAAAAQFERERISERTKEALGARRRRGVQLGRPRLGLQVDLAKVRERVAAGESVASIARSLNVVPKRGAAARPLSERTLRRLLRRA